MRSDRGVLGGTLPVAALRFREAIAGRILWLLPLHFALALAAAKAVPGPTAEARIQAADSAALALAAVLGLVAAAVLGAAPLPMERGRPRGTIVLAAPVGPTARILGTALGTGLALLLLLGGLCASAIAAVDLGAGAPTSDPHMFMRAASIDGGEPDPREPGLVWLTERAPQVLATPRVQFPYGASTVVVQARPRVAAGGSMPGMKAARIGTDAGEVVVHAGMNAPFRAKTGGGEYGIQITRVPGNYDLGVRADGVRVDVGPRSRIFARGLHAAALGAGLLAVMAAALALSTVAGSGVAAAGAMTLALLSLFRSTFADAASMLAHAGAVERAFAATTADPHLHADAQTVTPPALAPLFRAIAGILPDGTSFDFGSAVAANEVPDPGDTFRALGLGLAVAALFLAVALLGARRKP